MSYHIKRKDREITDSNVLRTILKSAKCVTIALSMDNEPYLVTLDYGYDEKHNCIYFHCAKEGKKLDYIKANNTVWGQVIIDYGYVEGECDHRYASVHFRGKVTLIDSLDEKRSAIECMIKQLDKDPQVLIEKTFKTDLERLKSTVFGRIDMEYLSGKQSKEIAV